MSAPPLRVAVLGAGTVGLEVVRGLVEESDRLARRSGVQLELVGIAVRDADAAVRRGLPAALLTDAPAHLVADPATDVIVELMGGDEPARTLVAAALGAGKAVVTANKHVVAYHGAELEAIARRADAPFRFEAAVGGGTPVLGPLAAELAATRVTAIRGIVNGTTNYILSAMTSEGRSYDEVLAAAQAAGYAEADPAGDVEGADAANKLVILARLAFGTWLDPAAIVTTPLEGPGRGRPGITGVTSADIEAAAASAQVVKLLATARRGDAERDGSPDVAGSVLPTLVPSDSPLGRTGGVLNRIEIDSDLLGTVAFEGPGAGGRATSSAVLADLIAVARGAGSTWAGLPPAERALAAAR
jgi:homoserine dehydrogenase